MLFSQTPFSSNFDLEHPKVYWFERVQAFMSSFERTIIFPVLTMKLTSDASTLLSNKFGLVVGSLILTMCAVRFLRSAFTNVGLQYCTLLFAHLLFTYDFRGCSEGFIVDLALVAFIICKVCIRFGEICERLVHILFIFCAYCSQVVPVLDEISRQNITA